MQAGLLYETLSGRSGAYVQQVTIACDHRLDDRAVRQAWQSLARHHGALRTSFAIGESAAALQRVHEEVELGIAVADWRSLDEQERERRWQELLLAERQAGFEPGHAPLMRVAVCHVTDAQSRMLWSYHHAILDGRSRLALLRELFELYDGRGSGEGDAAPASLPFEQFARWAAQRGSAHGTEVFWRHALAGLDGPTPAPGTGAVDGSQEARAHRSGGGGGSVLRTLDAELSQAVRDTAAAHELTPATILQGVYALLLSQEADSDDVLFATTRAGRRSAPFDTQGMVGLLMVTSPVRLHVQPQESVRKWFARVREFNVSVRDFEHAPLSDVRRWSEIPRPVPIAQTLFSYETASMNSLLRAADPAWERRDVQLIEQLDFPLTLEAFGDEQIVVRVLYDRTRVPDTEAERIGARYEELVRACVAQPLASVASVCELSAERRRLLSGELEDTRPATAQELVPARICEQIAANPGRIAVEHGEQRLSYRDVGARVEELSARLAELGAGSGTRVGIAMARTPELICALLAVHRTGAAYVPLDPRYPAERLAAMLEDSGAQVVVSDARSRDSLPPLERCAVLVVDELQSIGDAPHVDSEREAPSGQAPQAAIAPEDLSHLIFTSGSTDVPKAVMVEHRAVAQLTAWAHATFTDAQRDGMLASTSLSFDLSVFEILVTLALGGRIVLVENVLALSDPDFGQEIAFVNTVPSALSELLRAGELPSCVRTVALAGEALPASLVERLYAHESIDEVWNLYGPSEDTTYSTEYRCVTGQRPLIGRPLPGTQAYVVDRHLRPVGEGVAGELLLGGMGLARGYLNRAELTAERFRELTFAHAAPTRVYRTGDRVLWTQDGQLDYLGRVDNQVKIRGVRVEPDELAHALREQGSIDDAAVVVRGEGAGRRLVAYVVAAPGEAPDASVLQQALAARLPQALLPSAIVALDALPLTPNGKLDKRALPEPAAHTATTGGAADRAGAVAGEGAADVAAGGGDVAAGGGSEATRRALAEVWADVLELNAANGADGTGGPAAAIGPGDDFFELGGDSLKTLHLLAEVEDRFGRRLPVATLFSATTLAAQAAAIDAARSQRASSTLIPVRPAGSKPPWMCVLTDHRGVIGLRNLLPAMLSDQPVYAMQAIDPTLPSWRSSSVEQIAAACLHALRASYPHGPYRLGGHSLGGLVAFEMARRLTDAGEHVDLLILLDTLAPEMFRWRGRMAGRDRMLAGESLVRRARGQAHLARGGLWTQWRWCSGERVCALGRGASTTLGTRRAPGGSCAATDHGSWRPR